MKIVETIFYIMNIPLNIFTISFGIIASFIEKEEEL